MADGLYPDLPQVLSHLLCPFQLQSHAGRQSRVYFFRGAALQAAFQTSFETFLAWLKSQLEKFP